MVKVKEILPLLNDLAALLFHSKAQKRNIDGLSQFITVMEQLGDVEILELTNLVNSTQNSTHPNKTKGRTRNAVEFETVRIIKEHSLNSSLTRELQEKLEELRGIYPHIDLILQADLSNLYEVLFSLGPNGWRTDELNLIAYLFFDGKRSTGKKTKKQIFDVLVNNTYQHNYTVSVKKNFQSKQSEGADKKAIQQDPLIGE